MSTKKGRRGGDPAPSSVAAENLNAPASTAIAKTKQAGPPQISQETWASRIGAAWAQGVAAFIKAGQLLIEARARLGHGKFGDMVCFDLPFSVSTAERLMKIAKNEVLTDSAHGPNLPPSWRTLYELSRLRARRLRALIEDGTIHPGLERREAERLVANEIARTMRVTRSAPVPRPLDIEIQRSESPNVTPVNFRSSIARPIRPDNSMPTEDVPAELHKLAVKATEIIEPPVDRLAILLAAWDAAGEPERRRFLMRIGAHLVAEAER